MRVPKKNISNALYDLKPPKNFEAKNSHPNAGLEVLARAPALKNLKLSQEAKQAKVKVSDVDSCPAEIIKIREAKIRGFLGAKRDLKPKIRIPIRRKIGPAYVFSAIFMASVVFYGFGLYGSKEMVLSSFYKLQSDVLSSAEHFKNLKTNDAYLSLAAADSELKNIKNEFSRYGLLGAGEWFGFVFPTIKNINTVIQDLEIFFGSALSLSLRVEELKSSGFRYFLNGDGGRFIELLSAISGELKAAVKTGEGIANISSEIKKSPLAKNFEIPEISGDLAMFAEAYAASDFVEALLPLLKADSGTHLLLLFQNPSEIRPSGGFLGSYADLEIKKGALAGIDVRDIYDPDGWLNLKLIPPKPLQIQTVDWEARDANWFLDFSLSAGKVAKLLESSKFYEERGVKFTGVIGINTNVLKSIIKITGPIELPEYDLVLDENNFLEELQNEVEAGRNKAQNKPKKILSDMTPKLMSALSNVNEENEASFFDMLKGHAENKDIQIYFSDPKMQAFVDKYNLGGDIYALPQGFFGDYLAVVNANVAGGKTDAYISQDIELNSKIDSAGTLRSELKIIRVHGGGRTKYPWYNVTNKIFSRVLTPKGARLTGEAKGATERTIKPAINYEKEGYGEDGDVALMEKQKEESGKNIFEAWVYTNPGANKTLTLNYENNLSETPKNGLVYKFVLDKQSGVAGGLNYRIEAPPGFIWKESANTVFEYASENLPWRVELNLTLEEV